VADTVTEQTRSLIAEARTEGERALEAVERFVQRTLVARQAFDAEADPLHLPEADYEQVVEASGLGAVLDSLAPRIAEALNPLDFDRNGEDR
jgi:hypothetical protein